MPSSDINSKISYDLNNPSDFIRFRQYDIIIIEISFCQLVTDFYKSLIDLVKNGKAVYVRINSLCMKKLSDELLEVRIQYPVEVEMLLSNNSDSNIYQIYLKLHINTNIVKSDKDVKNSNCMRYFISKYIDSIRSVGWEKPMKFENSNYCNNKFNVARPISINKELLKLDINYKSEAIYQDLKIVLDYTYMFLNFIISKHLNGSRLICLDSLKTLKSILEPYYGHIYYEDILKGRITNQAKYYTINHPSENLDYRATKILLNLANNIKINKVISIIDFVINKGLIKANDNTSFNLLMIFIAELEISNIDKYILKPEKSKSTLVKLR